LTLDITVINL